MLELAMAKGAKASPAMNPAPPQIRMTLATIGITLWKILSILLLMALRWRLRRTRTALIRYIKPPIPITTKITPFGQLDCHGTSTTMLWSRTPTKLYNAGVSDACAMSSFREVDKPVPSVTTTNSNPASVPPATPVVAKKSL